MRHKATVLEPIRKNETASDDLILEVWKQAWDESDKTFPFNTEIDDKLSKIGVNAYMLEVRMKMLETKNPDAITPEEVALTVFYCRIKHVSRMMLLGKLIMHPPGQIHLARTIHGLEPNQKHEIKETRKLSDALKDDIAGTV